jgi:hypothetical protein
LRVQYQISANTTIVVLSYLFLSCFFLRKELKTKIMMSDNDALNDTNITSVTKKTNATEDLSISNIDEHAPATDNKKSKTLELDDGGSDVSVLSSELLGSARNTLFASVFLLLGDVMGTGVLSLPSSASKIGWGMSISALIVFAFAAFYSGVLLSAVKQKYPGEFLKNKRKARL